MTTIRWSRREKGLWEVGRGQWDYLSLLTFVCFGLGTPRINTSCLLTFTRPSVGITGLLAADWKLSSLLNVVPMGITNRLLEEGQNQNED